MKIDIFSMEYEIRPGLVKASRKIVRHMMQKVHQKSHDEGIPELYTAVVIMMYVMSYSVLKNVSRQDIKEILSSSHGSRAD